jgi:GNAT superfamily N-acetyltransferase
MSDVLLRDGLTAHIRPIRPETATSWSSSTPGLGPVEVLPVLHRDAQALRARRGALHPRRPRAAGGLRVTLKKRIIAPRQLRGDGSGKAEVASSSRDAQQGRGIGQLLLEHLAQAGRERGIERFVAEVLPDNDG